MSVTKHNVGRSRSLIIPVTSMDRMEAARDLPEDIQKWIMWDILIVLEKPGPHDMMRLHPWVTWAHDKWSNWRWLYGYARMINSIWHPSGLNHAAWDEIESLSRVYRPSTFPEIGNELPLIPGSGTVPAQCLKAAGGNPTTAHQLWLQQLKSERRNNNG